MKIYFLLITALLYSCNSTVPKTGDFKLLPTPQNFEISGVSSLRVSDLLNYYSPNELDLPAGSDFLGDIQAVDRMDNAQLVFTIEPEFEIKAEDGIEYSTKITGTKKR